MRLYFAFLVIAAFSTACASSSASRSPSRSMRVLSAEEMAGSSAKTAFEAVQLLRPQWLTARGVASPHNLGAVEPVVYVDNMKYGGLRSLESIYVTEIKEIRYLSASQATTRFGTGHVGGALLVTRK